MKSIPKVLHQIWLGPNPAPVDLMNSWKEKHPSWEYKVWTDKDLESHPWTCKRLIHQTDSYPGKADILRYEILYRFGGIYLDADSQCSGVIPENMLHTEFFACYENEIARPGLVANGYLGSVPGFPLLQKMIQKLYQRDHRLTHLPAWQVTGPIFLTACLREYKGEGIRIHPSYLFMPIHHTGIQYAGNQPSLGTEFWHSTPKRSS